MKYAISLIPNRANIDKIISFRKNILNDILDNNNLLPNFNYNQNIPHLTLLQFNPNGEVINNNFKKLDLILDIVKNSSSIKKIKNDIFNFNIADFTNDNWIFLKNNNIKSLQKIHNELFKILKDDLLPPEGKNESYNLFYSPVEIKYYDLYGYRYIKENFQPHITIGKLSISYFLEKYTNPKSEKKKIQDRIIQEVNNYDLNIKFEKLIFHNLGDCGSCKNLIKSLII